MRVLYDHQIFQEQEFGGISRYFAELYSNRSMFEAEIAVVRSDNRHLFSLPEMQNHVRPYKGEIDDWFWGLKFRGKKRLYDFIRTIALQPTTESVNRQHSIDRIQSSQHDVFHPTYYDPYFFESLGDRPFVLTVHDLIHEFFPGDFLPEDSTAIQKKNLCRKAARIIAVSNTTKNDLVERFGVDPNKIDVVYHGISINPANAAVADPGWLPNRYLLFTGGRTGYKNFTFFVRAVAGILREDAQLQLVCTGHPFTAEERSLFRELAIADRAFHCAASDRQLATLYSNAEALVFPTLYEGFGMPILEAFACGCTVVLSDTPATREIAEDAALLFNPTRASELADAVSKVLGNDVLKNTLVERGRQRASSFSWKTATSETAEVYRRALDGGERT